MPLTEATIKAAVAGTDATLLHNALVVAVDLAATGRERAAQAAGAIGDTGAHILLLAVVAAAVLQAFDFEVAVDIGDDFLAQGHCALQGSIAQGEQGKGLSCGDMRVGVDQVLTVCTTLATAA